MTGDDLRSVMRLFPSGVCVVTADADGDRIGVTIGSLVSLSLSPPLVGIAVGKTNALHEVLRAAGAFGVSFLRGDQAHIAARFALGMPPALLWDRLDVHVGTTGAPLLDDALAWLECVVDAEHGVGDHTLFVGEVTAAREGRTGSGLVYREHEYVPV
jgi:3-hydroxy-9,10-secoandrosta-1,3,5(10)-triene-9,17-dione monooxygenase reductase component